MFSYYFTQLSFGRWLCRLLQHGNILKTKSTNIVSLVNMPLSEVNTGGFTLACGIKHLYLPQITGHTGTLIPTESCQDYYHMEFRCVPL